MKVRTVLGGNVMMISTGSAPISAHVINFLKIAFYCEVVEGMHSTSTLLSISQSICFSQGQSRNFWSGVKG